MTSERPTDMRGLRVLVVEDEFLVGQEIRDQLERLGAHVIGPVPQVSAALATVTSEAAIDCATLDVALGDETCFDVADALLERNIPFVFVTAHAHFVLPAKYEDIPCCTKPVEAHHIATALYR